METNEPEFDENWTGETDFFLLRPPPAQGFIYAPGGEQIRDRRKDRPEWYDPTSWSKLCQQKKDKIKALWQPDKEIVTRCRERRGRVYIHEDEGRVFC